MCAIHKYLWHTNKDIILEKRGPQNTQISKQFIPEVYDSCIKRPTRGKAPEPNNISNDIIKSLPSQWYDLLFLFFQHCYKQKEISSYWKQSKTILLHKKKNPIYIANYRPIALANIIYKSYNNTITSLLTSYGEQHIILYFSQEGFRPQRNTSRQIQTIIVALEDTKLTHKDIYLTYIDLKKCLQISSTMHDY